MTIEEAKKEMDQALAAVQTAQQHLLEAASKDTQTLQDLRKILGVETPPLRLVNEQPKLALPAQKPEEENPKGAGRKVKSDQELLQELQELETITNPDKKTNNRKAIIRHMLKKRGALQNPKHKPAPDTKVELETKPDNTEVLEDPEAAPAVQETKYKVLAHEKGYWVIKRLNLSLKEADAEAARLLITGVDARVKKM